MIALTYLRNAIKKIWQWRSDGRFFYTELNGFDIISFLNSNAIFDYHLLTPPLPHSPTPPLPHSRTPPLPHSPTPALPHSPTPYSLLPQYLILIFLS